MPSTRSLLLTVLLFVLAVAGINQLSKTTQPSEFSVTITVTGVQTPQAVKLAAEVEQNLRRKKLSGSWNVYFQELRSETSGASALWVSGVASDQTASFGWLLGPNEVKAERLVRMLEEAIAEQNSFQKQRLPSPKKHPPGLKHQKPPAPSRDRWLFSFVYFLFSFL